jgi:hypothetical protein
MENLDIFWKICYYLVNLNIHMSFKPIILLEKCLEYMYEKILIRISVIALLITICISYTRYPLINAVISTESNIAKLLSDWNTLFENIWTHLLKIWSWTEKSWKTRWNMKNFINLNPSKISPYIAFSVYKCV